MGDPVRLDNGTVIGSIEGDTFSKKIAIRHMLKQPPAISIDAKVFDTVIRLHCEWMVIENRQTKERWRSSVHHFDEKKVEIDRGHGRQYYMVLSEWEDISVGKQLQMLPL